MIEPKIREEARKRLKEVKKAFQLGYNDGYQVATEEVKDAIDKSQNYNNIKH